MTKDRPLTILETSFIDNYLIVKSGPRAAAMIDGDERKAAGRAKAWMGRPRVRAEIDRRLARASEMAEMTSSQVMFELKKMALTDRRDLTEVHYDCCRYCYGHAFMYQETPQERRVRKKAHDDLLRATPQSQWIALPAFDEMGGVGYDPRKPPRDDCPECWGRGVQNIVVGDTRKYGEGAAAIYEGVKVTKEGLQVMASDRTKALQLLGSKLGMFDKSAKAGDVAGDVAGGGGLNDPDCIVYNSPHYDSGTDDTRESSGGDL